MSFFRHTSIFNRLDKPVASSWTTKREPNSIENGKTQNISIVDRNCSSYSTRRIIRLSSPLQPKLTDNKFYVRKSNRLGPPGLNPGQKSYINKSTLKTKPKHPVRVLKLSRSSDLKNSLLQRSPLNKVCDFPKADKSKLTNGLQLNPNFESQIPAHTTSTLSGLTKRVLQLNSASDCKMRSSFNFALCDQLSRDIQLTDTTSSLIPKFKLTEASKSPHNLTSYETIQHSLSLKPNEALNTFPEGEQEKFLKAVKDIKSTFFSNYYFNKPPKANFNQTFKVLPTLSTVFVRNIPTNYPPNELEMLLGQADEISLFKMHNGPVTTALVGFTSLNGAYNCIQLFDGHQLNGFYLKVSLAINKHTTSYEEGLYITPDNKRRYDPSFLPSEIPRRSIFERMN